MRTTAPASAGGTEQVLAAAYSHGPGKSLWVPPHPPGHRRPPAGSAVPLAAMAGATSLGTALTRTLTLALAPRRWEPWNAHNDHRAYPSPRSLNLTDVVVASGSGRWLIDPVRLTALPLARATENRRAAPPAVPPAATLELVVHPGRMPDGYGTLRAAAAILEAGHVSAALVEAATGQGLTAATRLPGGLGTLAASGGGALAAMVDLAPPATPSAPPSAGPCPSTAPGWPKRVTAHRSGGLGPHGRLSADPRPLAAARWHGFLDACGMQAPGSLAAQPEGLWLRHRLAVGNVAGVADGVYEWRAGRMERCGGPALAGLQGAFRFGPDVIDVAGLNVVWVMALDLARTVASHGPDAYPRSLLTAGAAAQHVCSAAAASGMFCRPVRSFEEPATEAAVGFPAGADAIYMLLLGRPRVLDFSYDLTDPQETP